MSRNLTEAQDILLAKMLREGVSTTRDIAAKVGCGTGTVTRRKRELGYEVRGQAGRVVKLLAPKVFHPNMKGGRPPNNDPSPAARRLAEFDPIVRRAITPRIEEDDDGE